MLRGLLALAFAAQLAPEGVGGKHFWLCSGWPAQPEGDFPSLSALARAVGLRPLTLGVHDEMLPGDQGEGGDEKNHWQIWSDREAAGECELLSLLFAY